MDKHIANDPQNPINWKETEEDREHAKNELMRDTLQELSIKYLGEDATDFYNDIEDLGKKDSHEIWEDLNDSQYFHVEIIYYHTAMEYLKEHDTSLSESIEIAHEYGYTLENINSETLASLHASRERENTFYEFVAPELDKIYNN
tara:strand:- start:363 stop:797 length:435 start_codon:yes stop_codon:yes gene_type:complete